MKLRLAPTIALALACQLVCAPAQKKSGEGSASAEIKVAVAKKGGSSGWYNWRGPAQNGTSPETGLPDKVDGAKPLWTADFPGQSAPVIANGKLYINGYIGEGPNLREGVSCFDAET